MSSRALAATGLVFALALGRDALATPSALFGTGPRAQALGGSGAASELGVESVGENPALLAGERPQALLGFRASRFAIDGVAGASDAASDAVLGFTVPLPSSSPRWSLKLGVIAASPRDLLVRAELPLAEEQDFPLLTSRAHALDFGAAAALRLDAFRVGLGVRGLAGLEGRAKVENDAGGARTEVNNTLAPSLAPVLGVAYELGRRDTFGFLARAALEARFDVTVRVGSVGSLTLPDLHVAGSAHYDPAELQVGWRRELGPGALQLVVGYKRWSDFESFVEPTVACPDDAPCAALPQERVSLSDTLVPRLGYEHRLRLGAADLLLRAGYFYEPTPLAEQRGVANRYDNDRHALTLGVGAALGDRARVDLGYQHHGLVERSHEKSSAVSPDNPGYPETTVSGSIDVVGLTLELEL